MLGASGIVGRRGSVSPNDSESGEIDEGGLIRRRHRMTPNQVCSHLIGRGLGDPRNNQRAVSGQAGFVVSRNVTSHTMASKMPLLTKKKRHEETDQNYAPVIKLPGGNSVTNQLEASKPLPNQSGSLAKSPNQLLPGDAVATAVNGIVAGSGGWRRSNYGFWAKLRAQAMVDNYRLHGKVREFCHDQEAITATGGVEEEVSFWEFVLPAYTRRNRPNHLLPRWSDDIGIHDSEDEIIGCEDGQEDKGDLGDGIVSHVHSLRLSDLNRLAISVDKDCLDGNGIAEQHDNAEVVLVKNYSMATTTPRVNPSLLFEMPRYSF